MSSSQQQTCSAEAAMKVFPGLFAGPCFHCP
jgi:hypothetical protein